MSARRILECFTLDLRMFTVSTFQVGGERIGWCQTGYVMRKTVSLVYDKNGDRFYAAPIHKPLPRVYWELLVPIDVLPSSLLNESPRLAQKKSVGYRPMMKCKQAIIDSHRCCCASGGGGRQSPHLGGRGSHRAPSRLKSRTLRSHFRQDFWHKTQSILARLYARRGRGSGTM